MKKLGILLGVFGLFALVGIASAATADELQPASTITYNEELVVNATGRFDSIYIGSTEAGVGGVTFFNGTIVNASVDEDGEDTIPVTFGDDVRIDGEIYRTEVGGDNPLKIADTLRPQSDDTYDLGTEANNFRNVYATNLMGGSATITSTLTVGSSASITDELTVADYIAVGGGYGDTGTTLDANGNGQFDGDLAVDGDINQARGQGGAVKALVNVSAAGTCDGASQWSFDGGIITCTRTATGNYTITFPFQVSDRFLSATIDNSLAINPGINVGSTGTNSVRVRTWQNGGAAFSWAFNLVVY